MKAAIFEQFRQPLKIENVPDPIAHDDGVVIQVKANGICRSDWHGWMGHDSDVQLPHVPGHELAGIVVETGKDVRRWKRRRPRHRAICRAVAAMCPQCLSGNQQICDNYFQPGFTAWGSFAQYVAIRYADTNLVRLPDEMDFVESASLGCRFITAFRAIVAQGRASPGEWVVVHGCGGLGLGGDYDCACARRKRDRRGYSRRGTWRSQNRLARRTRSTRATNHNSIQAIHDLTGRRRARFTRFAGKHRNVPQFSFVVAQTRTACSSGADGCRLQRCADADERRHCEGIGNPGQSRDASARVRTDVANDSARDNLNPSY